MTLETLPNSFPNGLYLLTWLLAVGCTQYWGRSSLFNIFTLLIGILLVSLHLFVYLNVFKVENVSLCTFTNFASFCCELPQCPICMGLCPIQRVPMALLPLIKKRNIWQKRKIRIVLTGYSTAVCLQAENRFINEITNIFILRNSTDA